MSRIKSRDSRAELIVRSFLFKNGLRFRKNYSKIIGTPDIVLPKYKTIVDVRGCFWHKHKNCKYGDQVKPDSAILKKRIVDAELRDKRNEKKWSNDGWKVIIVWDRCQLEDKRKSSSKRVETLNNILYEILNEKR